MLQHPQFLHIFLASVLGFTIAAAIVPPILNVAQAKRLFDLPSERKVHSAGIPPLGGIAIFVAFMLATILASYSLEFYSLRYLHASLILLFFIGLNDDLLPVAALLRLVVQALAVIIMMTFGNLQLTNFHGLFGIHQIPVYIGMPLTLVVMLSIINAFNLIDGIDGLASGLAIAGSFILGSWFVLAGHLEQAVVAFALTGSLGGFFLFNVFGRTHKLFMGDTGSLVVGMIMSVLVIRFCELNIGSTTPLTVNAAPVVAFAVVAVPLTDMFRVMSIRILSGRSPFLADKNHIHHRLLEFFPSHLTVTLIMVTAALMLTGIALVINHLFANITLQFLGVFLFSLAASFIPSRLLMLRKKRQQFPLKTFMFKPFQIVHLSIDEEEEEIKCM